MRRERAEQLVLWLMNSGGPAPAVLTPDVTIAIRRAYDGEEVSSRLSDRPPRKKSYGERVLAVLGAGDESVVLGAVLDGPGRPETTVWWLRWRGDRVCAIVQTGARHDCLLEPQAVSGDVAIAPALEALFTWWRDGEGPPPDVFAPGLQTAGMVDLPAVETWLAADHPRWLDIQRVALVAEGGRAAILFDGFHPIDRELYRIVWWVTGDGGRIATLTLVAMPIAGRPPPRRDLPARFPPEHPLHGRSRDEVARQIMTWICDARGSEPDAFTNDVAVLIDDRTGLAEQDALNFLARVRRSEPYAESQVIDAITEGDQSAVLAAYRHEGGKPALGCLSPWFGWQDDRVRTILTLSAQVYEPCAHPVRALGPDDGPSVRPALEALLAWWLDGDGPPPDVLTPDLKLSRSRYAPQHDELLAPDRERWHHVVVRGLVAEGSRAAIYFDGFQDDSPFVNGMFWWVSGRDGRIATLTYAIQQIMGGARERPD